jgi:hypothetical protein
MDVLIKREGFWKTIKVSIMNRILLVLASMEVLLLRLRYLIHLLLVDIIWLERLMPIIIPLDLVVIILVLTLIKCPLIYSKAINLIIMANNNIHDF